ncbi:MAG: hypothetical protein ABWZ02_10280 [Nakamurella sp.]
MMDNVAGDRASCAIPFNIEITIDIDVLTVHRVVGVCCQLRLGTLVPADSSRRRC